MSRFSLALFALAVALAGAAPLRAQSVDSTGSVPPTPNCPSCESWNETQRPFRVFGSTYYVGTHGLAAVLITSSEGHVLIDGGLPESALRIVAAIRELGFRIEDVKLLLNSHVHFDHAGGLARLQRLSGASVAASPSSAEVLRRGTSGRDDPQFGILEPIAPLTRVQVVADGAVLHVGPVAVTAHFTAGATPRGPSRARRAPEGARRGDARLP